MAKVVFSDKDLSSTDYLPEGESNCTITKVMDKHAKSGTSMVEVTFTDRAGRADRENFVLSEKALFRLARLATACGLTSKGLDTDSLRGRKVRVIKEFKGMRTGNDGKEYKEYNLSFAAADVGSDAGSPSEPSSGDYSLDEMPF